MIFFINNLWFLTIELVILELLNDVVGAVVKSLPLGHKLQGSRFDPRFWRDSNICATFFFS